MLRHRHHSSTLPMIQSAPQPPDPTRHLARLLLQDNAVLFIGTDLFQGTSDAPLIEQLTETLAARIHYTGSNRTLAAVARDFIVEHNSSREPLLLIIQEELDRFQALLPPPHHQIGDAVLPNTKIITTRIDHAIERTLDHFAIAYVPIVRDTDVPFFDEAKVVLIKLLGDIDRPESLVLTEDDIDAFIENLPTLSDVVRMFLATKTLIFVGHDLEDDLFKRLFRRVSRSLTAFRRKAYAVVGHPMRETDIRYWREQGVEIHEQPPLEFLVALGAQVKTLNMTEQTPMPSPIALIEEPPLPSSPYKALASFEASDVAIFAGRDEESQRLTNRILAHRLTVLDGESGSGKTSLLRAGAGPRLAKQRALLAICTSAPNQPLARLLSDSVSDAGAQVALHAPDMTLTETIRLWQQTLDGPIVLAIDQFEQFFMVYTPEERVATLQWLTGLLDDKSLNLRLVLVVRDDFLWQLHEVEKFIPGLLVERFHLERLGRVSAQLAITEPARRYGITWEPELVQLLLNTLYDGASGGVAPPQLQLICDRLYQNLIHNAQASDSTITTAGFRRLGGTETILGDYLTDAVESFAEDERPLVRTLLGALVSSRGVKQRLTLDELTRIIDIDPPRAIIMLDKLTNRWLLRRYEVVDGSAQGAETGDVHLEYELIHDSLVTRILAWLGEDFWTTQQVREILRLALPNWQERHGLLAPDELKLAGLQRGRLRFTPEEDRLLYASAIVYQSDTYDADLTGWAKRLADAERRTVLHQLLQHGEELARGQAARYLREFAGPETANALTHVALHDPDTRVRRLAAESVATIAGQDAELRMTVVSNLVIATDTKATASAAQQALVTMRDLAPASHELLPDSMRSSIQRQVWRARRERHRLRIQAATLRAMQGGFWGLGLSGGLLIGKAFSDQFPLDLLSLILLVAVVIMLAGVLGTVVTGLAANIRAILYALEDQDTPLRSWSLTAMIAGVLMALSLGIIGQALPDRDSSFISFAIGGLLIGFVLAGVAAIPWQLPTWMRHTLTSGAGIVVFILVLSRIVDPSPPGTLILLALMGAVAGAGFAYALDPTAARPVDP